LWSSPPRSEDDDERGGQAGGRQGAVKHHDVCLQQSTGPCRRILEMNAARARAYCESTIASLDFAAPHEAQKSSSEPGL